MVHLEPVLLALSGRLKSVGEETSISTNKLGELLGVSQQTASRYLIELAQRGWVSRRRDGRHTTLKLTPEGVAVLRRIHISLGRLLAPGVKAAYEGMLVSGIGEGAYYVREYTDKIKEVTGYRPFYGTLNIQFEGGRPDLTAYESVDVGEFKSGDRSFGGVQLTPVTLKMRGKSIRCHAIVPERTHHERDIELIARHNLRRKYGLRDGDNAIVEVS